MKTGDENLKRDNDGNMESSAPSEQGADSNIGEGLKKRKSRGDNYACLKKPKLSGGDLNALQRMSQLVPGIKYVVESHSGPLHWPIYEVSVTVDGEKYFGRGNSIQMAKHEAAQAALSSSVQFRNISETTSVLSEPSGPSGVTVSNVKNEGCIEVHKNGRNDKICVTSGVKPVISSNYCALKVLAEGKKKNPVTLLHEILPNLVYTFKFDFSADRSECFRMIVEVEGKTYEGTGKNKKQARASAASAAISALYNISSVIYPQGLVYEDLELFSFPQSVADEIAKRLMSTFMSVMVRTSDYSKWKVIAGIAMTKDELMEDVQIISFGTGTKCINGEHVSMIGANINDCHAEVISRRCLKDFFYSNLELLIEGEAAESIFMKKEGGGFCLKPFIKFHLYISSAPCGDARIFSSHDNLDYVECHSRGILRTKIESGEGTIPVKGGQSWDSILPGQERLLTMSCSDKIASWNVLGLQGALLSIFVEPIYLDSVILGGLYYPKSDDQSLPFSFYDNLCHTLFSRFENHLKDLPSLYHINKPKICITSSPEMRLLSKPPNFSVNWTVGLRRVEVVNAITGKTKSGQLSRLCKSNFFQRFWNIYGKLTHVDNFKTPYPPHYGAFKSMVKDYREAQETLNAAFVAAGLGHWVKKPVVQNFSATLRS